MGAGAGRVTPSDATILVVDDEPILRMTFAIVLRQLGATVHTSANGLEALEKLTSEKPDLLITDLAMPILDGLELTKRARQTTGIPIIVLSVRDTEAMKIKALDEGADDYVTKPFSTPELLARVRSHLRRAPADLEGPLYTGDFVLDKEAHTVTLRGTPLSLTPKEFDLLSIFVLNPERVLTHKVLLRRVWGEFGGDQVENLRVLVASLRKKLEKGGPMRYIENEPWVGYRFMPHGVAMTASTWISELL